MFDNNGIPSIADGQVARPGRGTSASAGRLMRNRILGALRAEERERLSPKMQQVELTLGKVIYQAGTRLEYLYFPTTAVVSSVYTTRDGESAQVALIGNEGVTGLELFLGGESAHYQSVAQISGEAIRILAKPLLAEFAKCGAFQREILRYGRALFLQVSQTAVCNRLHSVEQRLCRWLLECDDRVSGDEITMTQETIAHMLGVRREGVTVAAGRLQDSGLIQYSRGHIHILHRGALATIACECYRGLEAESSQGVPELERRPSITR
jgi:CRP-like cAMP-binding protein